jgi:hypothetical protein
MPLEALSFINQQEAQPMDIQMPDLSGNGAG